MFKFDDKLWAECWRLELFSTIKNERNMKWFGRAVDVVSKEEEQEQSQDFCYDCENFAGITKISQS